MDLNERRAVLKNERSKRHAARSKEQQQQHDSRHRRNVRILKELNIGNSKQAGATTQQGAGATILDTRHK